MLIKSADDKSKRLKLLEDLQLSDRLDARQKEWLAEELLRLRRGMAGERDAAHYLDLSFSESKNHAVLHDLRLEADGQTAQIDHLIVGRGLIFYLLETKTYGGSLRINAHGEFSVEYANQRSYGIESPLEQSRRHETVLKKVLERLGIDGRLGTSPTFVHVVMVHPKAIIHRPPKGTFDTSTVIKADQFATWHANYVETLDKGSVMAFMLNLRGRDTVMEWGEMLKREHKPANLLALPEFMKPKAETGAKVMQSGTEMAELRPRAAAAALAASVGAEAAPSPMAHLCAACGKRLTPKVVQFCQDQTKRFGGKLYCYEHQGGRKRGEVAEVR